MFVAAKVTGSESHRPYGRMSLTSIIARTRVSVCRKTESRHERKGWADCSTTDLVSWTSVRRSRQSSSDLVHPPRL